MTIRPYHGILIAPRMQIVWQVLEQAKDVGDQQVIAACRRLIHANRLGWRKYAHPHDAKLVFAFADYRS